VLDTAGKPLEGVEILLAGVARTVSTNAAGRFAFDSLPAREYNLTARLPGYGPERVRIPIRAGAPLEVEIRMAPRLQQLETIIVEGSRRGLYGVVGDSLKQPVAGARVDVHGANAHQVTDSAGRFAFPDIKGGDYLLVATAGGQTSRPMNVNVPYQGAKEVVLFVAPPLPGRAEPPGMYWVYHDLGVRNIRYPASKRMNGDELRRFPGRPLCDVARIRAVAGGDVATVVLNGVQVLYNWPLCEFSSDEVGFVEWAACVALGAQVNAPAPMRLRGSSSRGQVSCLMVWTR